MYTFPFVPLRYGKTLTIGILILGLCLIPSSELSKIRMPVTFTDVILHFIMFFSFSCALTLDITKKRINYKVISVTLIAFLVSIGLAVMTELLQFVIISLNRSGSYKDLFSDFAGSATGMFIGFVIRRKFSFVS